VQFSKQLIHDTSESSTDSVDESFLSLLAISFLPGIGPVLARQLISYCGSPEAVFRTKRHLLERIPGIGRERAATILRSNVRQQADRELAFILRNEIKLLPYFDKCYPQRLRPFDDAPLLLYVKGNGELNAERTLAIVGTRFMTDNGRSLTERLIQELLPYKVTVISGLAYGVDITAHRESLRVGLPTFGVVAHGLDRLYPSAHQQIAEKMLEHGGIISEFPAGVKPDRDNFPARNRIVAGMTDATIVVESAEKGGALITAEFANDYNKDVFAFPGRPDDRYSRGCNKLIGLHKAQLIENAEQLAACMNWKLSESGAAGRQTQLQLPMECSPQEEKLLRYLQNSGNVHLDQIAWECSEPVSKVSALLLQLEFKGLVKTGPGKMFKLSG
jgi:DNA processing protein